jgi:hypothetical protein
MSAAAGLVFAVLGLSKGAWRVGIALSNLDEDVEVVGSTVKNLAGEVKSLGVESDLVYATLEELNRKSEAGLPLAHHIDNRVWDCLVAQVDEGCRTIQELELYVKIVRGEETKFIGQAQRLRKLDKSKDRIANAMTRVARHIENFRFTLLLINM